MIGDLLLPAVPNVNPMEEERRMSARLKSFARNTPSDPPPHPRLVGAVGIAELALQIALLPRHDADIDHPHERHDEPDGPQASRRDA